MKKFKLIALALAVVMLSACFVGCEKTEKVTVNAKVTFFANDEIMYGPAPVELTTDAATPPTILQMVQQALSLEGMPYADDGMSFTSINNLDDKVEGDYTYYWEFTINGVAPETGRAGTITANNDDVIVFTYVKVLTSELIAAEGEKK